MQNSAIAKRYAQTLLIFDQEQTVFTTAQNMVPALQEPQVATLLHNPQLSAEQKQNAIIQAFPQMPPVLLQFLALVTRKKRVNIIADILQVYIALFEVQQGVKKGTLISAIPLTADQVQKIAHKFKSKTGLDYRFEQQIDPEIIGGLKIKIDDLVFDWSLKSQLKSLHHRFSSTAG